MKTKFNVIARCADGDVMIGKDGINEFDWDEAKEIADAHKTLGTEIIIVTAKCEQQELTIKEFVEKNSQITKDGDCYWLDYESPHLGFVINNYAKEYLRVEELAVFNALAEIDDDFFEIDFNDCENIESGFEVTFDDGVVGNYNNDTKMEKVFLDCLNKLLDKYAHKKYLIRVMLDHLCVVEE